MSFTIRLEPTRKQDQVWQAWLNGPETFIGFGGGAGGGKSWVGCEIGLVQAYTVPGSKFFIAREELKRLMTSTYLTFVKVCQHHGVPQDEWKLNGQYNFIEFRNGSRIDLLDVKETPSDPLFERFGSLEYTDGWMEEAGESSFRAFDVLKSRIGRHLNKELNIKPKMLLTFNPNKAWLYQTLYKPYKENKLSPDWKFIPALFNDNPHTAFEYGQMLEKITDVATKERLMNGNWEYDDDPSALLDYNALLDIFTNTVEKSEEKYLVADIARFGSDKVTISLWKGMEAYKLMERQHRGIDQTSIELREIAAQEQIPYSHIIADEVGVGGGVIDSLKGIKGFIANSRPLQRLDGKVENFQSLKDQCGYLLAEVVNSHKLAVRCDESIRRSIIQELEQLKSWQAEKDGKRKLLPKDEIKKLIGRSPDWLDNLMMRIWFELPRSQHIKRELAPLMKDQIVKQHFLAKQGRGNLSSRL